jgi:starch synthase
VRATGGLDDTIEHFDGKSGTGFKFHDYSPQALLATIQAALDAYRDSQAWHQVMQNGMKKDYSWSTSAREYSKIYEALKKAKA